MLPGHQAANKVDLGVEFLLSLTRFNHGVAELNISKSNRARLPMCFYEECIGISSAISRLGLLD